MTSRNRVLYLIIFLSLVLSASSLFARPEPEVEDPSGRRSLYLLVESKAAENEIYLTRFLLPSSLSLFTWSDFAVRGSEVSVEGEESFRIRERELEIVGSHGQYQIVKYSFLISDLPTTGQRRESEGKRYEIRFSSNELLGKNGDVLYQPARWAALQAVELSGKSQGSLKVLSLIYAGDGRFGAEVSVL